MIAATADIHAPIYTNLFKKAISPYISGEKKCNLFLIAGDIIDRGRVEELERIVEELEKLECEVVACFGNNEYEELEDEVKRRCPNIRFLNDEKLVLEVENVAVGIVGSRGVLDKPTRWQSENIPGIREKYSRRVKLIERELNSLKTDLKILLIHYPPTYKILKGENPRIYPQMGSAVMEKTLLKTNVDLVVTGHTHRGLKKAVVGRVFIYNVSLPVNESIVEIDLKKHLRRGLDLFLN